MKHFIPTFEEAIKITEANPCFTHRIREVNGFKISIFDYMLASYNDFENPSNEVSTPAFELRGLCFVHDGEKRVRYLMLHKFFNLNQCKNYQLSDVKDKRVVKVLDKLDGSVMRFVKLPDGTIVPKSKTFFDNDQTMMAQRYYDAHSSFRKFVEESIDLNLAAIFELTSPLNKVVVDYKKTELTLIALRDESTGEYLDLESHELLKKHNIKPVEHEPYDSIEKLLELKPVIVNKEGWIVVLEDGQMLKVKGDEYCRLHNLITEVLSREDFVLDLIIDEKIDDALAELDAIDPRKDSIEQIMVATNHYIVKQVKDSLELASKYNGDKKEFALKFKQEEVFHFAAKILHEENKEEVALKKVKESLKKEIYFLKNAQKFIKEKLNLPLLREIIFSDEDS